MKAGKILFWLAMAFVLLFALSFLGWTLNLVFGFLGMIGSLLAFLIKFVFSKGFITLAVTALILYLLYQKFGGRSQRERTRNYHY